MITGKEFLDVVENSGLENKEKWILKQYRKESKIMILAIGLICIGIILIAMAGGFQW